MSNNTKSAVGKKSLIVFATYDTMKYDIKPWLAENNIKVLGISHSPPDFKIYGMYEGSTDVLRWNIKPATKEGKMLIKLIWG